MGHKEVNAVRSISQRLREDDEAARIGAAAEFARLHEAEVRRRLSSSLWPSARRVVGDSDDLWSDVCERFIEEAARGVLGERVRAAGGDDEAGELLRDALWRLAGDLLRDANRRGRREQVAREPMLLLDSAEAGGAAQDIRADQLGALLEKYPDPMDNLLIRGKAQGRSIVEIAAGGGISLDAAYKRWQRLKKRMQEDIERERRHG